MDFDRWQFLPRDAILARYMLWPCVRQSVSVTSTGVDKGEQGAQPPNGRAKSFLDKIEGLSSFTTIKLNPGLPPAESGRVCYDNPTGTGYC